MAGSIFISYRREDEQGYAARLYERLVEVYGKDRVFFDVDSIPLGFDFVRFIDGQIRLSDIVLVVIGRNWLDAKDDQGRRRLDNPADFVRIEVESALRRKKHVVPILVQGASMPRTEELPQKMRALTRRNAFLSTHVGFRAEVDRLVAHLSHPDLAEAAAKRPRTTSAGTSRLAAAEHAAEPSIGREDFAAGTPPALESAVVHEVPGEPALSTAPESPVEDAVAEDLSDPHADLGGASDGRYVEDAAGAASEGAPVSDYASVYYVPADLLDVRGSKVATPELEVNGAAAGSFEEPSESSSQTNSGMAIFMTIVAVIVTAAISMIYFSGKL